MAEVALGVDDQRPGAREAGQYTALTAADAAADTGGKQLILMGHVHECRAGNSSSMQNYTRYVYIYSQNQF
jgi:hypothetical protein